MGRWAGGVLVLVLLVVVVAAVVVVVVAVAVVFGRTLYQMPPIRSLDHP